MNLSLQAQPRGGFVSFDCIVVFGGSLIVLLVRSSFSSLGRFFGVVLRGFLFWLLFVGTLAISEIHCGFVEAFAIIDFLLWRLRFRSFVVPALFGNARNRNIVLGNCLSKPGKRGVLACRNTVCWGWLGSVTLDLVPCSKRATFVVSKSFVDVTQNRRSPHF